MPSETDSLPQAADRQEQVSSLLIIYFSIKPETYFTRTFSVVYGKASIC